jgi:polyhydroxyalkanoate synthesis repressor PhaR
MSERRWIKKYPNRRLYDTAEGRYITLADVRRLVVENIDFVVTVNRTREDITRAILMQVFVEQELGREPLMTEDFLLLVIQSQGGAIQPEVSTHLEQSLKLFLGRRQFFGGGPLLRDPKAAGAAGARQGARSGQ